MDDRNWMMLLSEEHQVGRVMKTNQYTEQFGLRLSEREATELVRERIEVLQEQQRVEFRQGILEKLIFAFCDSAYIQQNDYAETIGRLQEIFYLYKNESLDEWTDDELISLMRNAFEEECQGSLDYLEETYLEYFSRKVRSGNRGLTGRENEDEV
ncbi:MAG: DUF6323 family protein [Candidatus Choladocola sp.]|nr:DUF6323 family protein [Candidatus Choladocola sp.]